MSLDSILWLAERAGWAWLAELDGTPQMSARAKAMLGRDPVGSFDSLAAELTQLSESAVAAAVDRTELAGRDGRCARWVWTDQGRVVIVSPPPAPVATESLPAHDELARAVGHELGNALGALVGWIGLFREHPEKLTPDALAKLERAAATARRAARDLIGGPDGSEANVHDVVHDVARLLEPMARSNGTHISVQVEQDTPTSLPRGELFRIIWNLALNGVQMTVDGTVTLAAHLSNGRLSLEVVDDGPGMSPEVRRRIFEAGYGKRRGGTGLGLALVARTVRALAGSVQVSSEPGNGTHFHITLPVPPRTSTVLPKLVPRRVLVIEDDMGIRELVETTLSLRGIEVTAAGSLAEVHEVKGVFDVALADLTLPDGKGDSLLAQLKKTGVVARTVLMSGEVDPGELRGPPDGWLSKPFDVHELCAVIEGHGEPLETENPDTATTTASG